MHAFDADPRAPTYLFIRGDERNPDKSRIITPGVPESLGGALSFKPISLPHTVSFPDRRDFVVSETISAGELEIKNAKKALEGSPTETDALTKSIVEMKLTVAKANHAALLAVLDVEKIEDTGDKSSDNWRHAAERARSSQLTAAASVADLNASIAIQNLNKTREAAQTPGKADPKAAAALASAQTNVVEAQKSLAAAKAALAESANHSIPAADFGKLTPRKATEAGAQHLPDG